jgi:hypothetical protein
MHVRTSRTPAIVFRRVVQRPHSWALLGQKFSSSLFTVTSTNGFYPPPPPSTSKIGWKLFCNENIVYRNLPKALRTLKIMPRKLKEIVCSAFNTYTRTHRFHFSIILYTYADAIILRCNHTFIRAAKKVNTSCKMYSGEEGLKVPCL